MILVLAGIFIYHRVNNNANLRQFQTLISHISRNQVLTTMSMVVLLMVVNWLLESFKWQYLARALVKNPPLLIFDEPCQGLDTHQQQHFKHIVDAICQLGNTTLIYVTHYQHEILDSVDSVLRLDKGVVVN